VIFPNVCLGPKAREVPQLTARSADEMNLLHRTQIGTRTMQFAGPVA
jgi:hypothetical protein